MADTRFVEFSLPPSDVAVLQIDRVVSPKEAAQIKAKWRERTGRDCVLITGGLRVVAVVQCGTPIFDELFVDRYGDVGCRDAERVVPPGLLEMAGLAA